MAKVINEANISIQMWSNITLSADEIQEIYPAFADMVDGDDTDELEQAIQDHVDMNYLDLIQYADGAIDEATIDFEYEDDGSE
jgi:hypothetical protein